MKDLKQKTIRGGFAKLQRGVRLEIASSSVRLSPVLPACTGVGLFGSGFSHAPGSSMSRGKSTSDSMIKS